jgi:NhaP-type Na+/H+ or K+/H+ antiporter
MDHRPAARSGRALGAGAAGEGALPDFSGDRRRAAALGAIVAPPDAAATAILRQVNLPYRILKILEGESLLKTPARFWSRGHGG